MTQVFIQLSLRVCADHNDGIPVEVGTVNDVKSLIAFAEAVNAGIFGRRSKAKYYISGSAIVREGDHSDIVLIPKRPFFTYGGKPYQHTTSSGKRVGTRWGIDLPLALAMLSHDAYVRTKKDYNLAAFLRHIADLSYSTSGSLAK